MSEYTSIFQNAYNNNKAFKRTINKISKEDYMNPGKITGGGNKQDVPAVVIGAIITAISTAISTGVGIWQQKKQHQLNEESANNSDLRTRALYNDLESPQAKVQQLQDAGLSIGMMYGGGGLSGGLASGAQAPGTGMVDGSNILGMLPALVQSLTNMKKSNAEIDNIKKDTELKEAEINNKNESTNLTKALISEKEMTNALINPTFELNKNQMEAMTAKYWAEQKQLLLENEFNEKTMEDRVNSVKKYNDLLDSQINLTKAQTETAKAQKELIMQEKTNAKEIGRILKCDADTAEMIWQFKTTHHNESVQNAVGGGQSYNYIQQETMLDMLTKLSVYCDGYNNAVISAKTANNFDANLWFHWINEGVRTTAQTVQAGASMYGVTQRNPVTNNYIHNHY